MFNLWLLFNGTYLLMLLAKWRSRKNKTNLDKNKTEYFKKWNWKYLASETHWLLKWCNEYCEMSQKKKRTTRVILCPTKQFWVSPKSNPQSCTLCQHSSLARGGFVRCSQSLAEGCCRAGRAPIPSTQRLRLVGGAREVQIPEPTARVKGMQAHWQRLLQGPLNEREGVAALWMGGGACQRGQLPLNVWKGPRPWRHPMAPCEPHPGRFPSLATVTKIHLKCHSLHVYQ